jgi:LemA protein
MSGLILIAVLGVILLWAYGIYVGLIKKKNKAKEAFSGIDIQLKKRTDLIPNILAIAKKYMSHEAGLLEEITKLRSQAGTATNPADAGAIKDKLALESQLSSKMGSLMVSVENYPELKADQTMMQAQMTYNEIEEQISASRRFYNSAVNELNNSVEIFPSSLIASLINIKAFPLFEATEAERVAPNAAEILN